MYLGLNLYRFVRDYFERLRLEVHRTELLSRVQGGEFLCLDGFIRVIHPNKLSLGKHVYIGGNAYMNCAGGIHIGDGAILSRNVTVYSYDHDFRDPGLLPYDEKLLLRPVRIGAYAWIGMNVTIAPGTTVGEGAVIGMGTVVSGIIPQNAIVVNAMPRILGYRDSKEFGGMAKDERFFNKIFAGSRFRE